ncbi:threonine dehydrogenase-like Zn-dependent dehydrogenase [Anseongella ginsenosidimutans]|uniref:Threonine dehydrogenase-like Zn-dependent dehydrogenase n=1 Tax=Anseongella ginsenosidimutans TaxID=496056 RepID=A0A4R3KM92_9SPHI|nr:glucose 1-dehydrogenase [Anseongella ginsenosidimutans]TCS85353.1 threonine dehydrogenase-like Zn-dependent dehydrogenase [Anseongella ginsenosidimutans]
MKAIALVPGTTTVSLKDVPEPAIEHTDDIKIKISQVGICGTDREQAEGGRADAPPGRGELIIGHEMFGQVLETGSTVEDVRKGDFGVFTVRRGCGKCAACEKGRSDMCLTGDYTERGIKGADGFQAEFVVDREAYFVKVPGKIAEIGVLTEPMSVAAKAIDEALRVQQARLNAFEDTDKWFRGKKALIAGIGPIGLMAAFALRLRGAEVVGMDIVDEDTLRPEVLRQIGGKYIDGRITETRDLDEVLGQIDFVFEAAGIAKLQIQLIDTLGMNAIYLATGIPAGSRPLTVNGAELMQQLVLKNQVLIGSVNAGIEHYKAAVAYLEASLEKWPDAIRQVITERIPASDFKRALEHHSKDEIKVVVEWA